MESHSAAAGSIGSVVCQAPGSADRPVGQPVRFPSLSASIGSSRYRIPKVARTGKRKWQGNVGQGNKNGNPIPLPALLESVAESASPVISAVMIVATSALRYDDRRSDGRWSPTAGQTNRADERNDDREAGLRAEANGGSCVPPA